ncbi:MAG: DinB family protein [Chloroflexia bacterium]
MQEAARRTLVMELEAGCAPEIAPWLWAIEDARRRTLVTLEGITPEVLDWTPPAGENAIGTILYHIAAIELDWLYVEVLEQPDFPPEVEALFPLDVRNADGRLTPCPGLTIAEHLARFETTRAMLLGTFRAMSVEEFRRVRHLRNYDVTPEWVLHHLMQHEAEHRGRSGWCGRWRVVSRES